MLLVGGSSRIPLVAQLVSEGLARPVAVDTDPKNAIAKGAALSVSPMPTASWPEVAIPPVPAGSSAAATARPRCSSGRPSRRRAARAGAGRRTGGALGAVAAGARDGGGRGRCRSRRAAPGRPVRRVQAAGVLPGRRVAPEPRAPV